MALLPLACIHPTSFSPKGSHRGIAAISDIMHSVQPNSVCQSGHYCHNCISPPPLSTPSLIGKQPARHTVPSTVPVFNATSGLSVLANAATHLEKSPVPVRQTQTEPVPRTTVITESDELVLLPVSSLGLPGSRLPPKLRARILALEFIDMSELLPESWQFQEEHMTACCQQPARRPRHSPVTDITTWVDCYATLVAVLCSSYFRYAPEFMACQQTIVRAAKDFKGTCWVTYDICYRRQPAMSTDLHWSRRDADLYQEAFTGRARLVQRCSFCLSREHQVAECQWALQDSKPDNRRGASRTPTTPPATPAGGRRRELQVELCGMFNKPDGNACWFKFCKYIHACKGCHLPHPYSDCRRARRDRSPIGRP